MIPIRLAASLAAAAVALQGCAALDRRIAARKHAAEAVYPPEGRFVTVSGRRVHYVQRGHGPDLVLIHGASGSTRDWTFSFVDRVTDRYRVTVFDRPGLGYTDRIATNGASSPQAQAALLAAAADRIGVEHPIVLGHSYGGAVAMAWGVHHDAAALVILSGATEPWPGESLGPVYDLVGSRLGNATLVPLITAWTTPGLVRWVIDSIFTPNAVPEGYAEQVGAPLTLRRQSFIANARQVNTLRPHLVELSRHYGEIEIPVEIVHGMEDEIVPGQVHAAPMARQIPDAHLTWLEGVGHMPHHAAPLAVEQAIDRAARRSGLRLP
ncbi:hypothetical protein OCGS_2239 [Oceaniovalibus guishaninsula JLT2003]|uniref:AB hydrolase-1 domain-containing protein n=1 Tax=Oceaniovalibus guishaninsula JLT2003 TaxID=1231392 RepID=K2HA48_9RHOB|nr:alpha/beta hydrolase [Oceaniovalibus guishaninsula]EKE43507.1 hypothetical protein OCGS_2239 [Oceaniovalibus guishaninsula JLT2003]